MVQFQAIDWVVVAAYFAVVLGISWWSFRQRQKSTEDYFLASRHIGWFVVGASIFASNIGAEHIVGLAGTAAKTGVVMGHYELHAWLVLVLGWFFIPFYMRSKVFTMPEFLELRYSPKARWFLSIISLIAYVFTKICVNVYAGAVVFQTLMGIDFWTGALIIVVLTGVYTVLGGMQAVVYTEALQTIVLVIGLGHRDRRRLDQDRRLVELRPARPGSDHLNLFLPANHPEFPWPGMIFAPPIVGFWYWCTDQYIVQRALAAKNEQPGPARNDLRLLPQAAAVLYLHPARASWLMSWPRPASSSLPLPDQAFPTMVMTLIPIGLRGLVAGGLLAALMSSLASTFNSSSTLFTMDIYKKFKPRRPANGSLFASAGSRRPCWSSQAWPGSRL